MNSSLPCCVSVGELWVLCAGGPPQDRVGWAHPGLHVERDGADKKLRVTTAEAAKLPLLGARAPGFINPIITREKSTCDGEVRPAWDSHQDGRIQGVQGGPAHATEWSPCMREAPPSPEAPTQRGRRGPSCLVLKNSQPRNKFRGLAARGLVQAFSRM
jgi:hypothetical protein